MFDRTAPSHAVRLRRERQKRFRQRRRDRMQTFKVDCNRADLVQLLRDWNLIDKDDANNIDAIETGTKVLQIIGLHHIEEQAVRLADMGWSRRKIRKLMKDLLLPQMNAWVAAEAMRILATINDEESPSIQVH